MVVSQPTPFSHSGSGEPGDTALYIQAPSQPPPPTARPWPGDIGARDSGTGSSRGTQEKALSTHRTVAQSLLGQGIPELQDIECGAEVGLGSGSLTPEGREGVHG